METLLFVPPGAAPASMRQTSPANFGKKAAAGIITGAVILAAGNGMTSNISEPGEFWIITSIAAALFGWAMFIWGCMNLARWKGYSEWFGFLGYLLLLGLIILGCFPNRRKELIEKTTANPGARPQENDISVSRIVLALAPLGVFVVFLGGCITLASLNISPAEWTQVGSPEAGFEAMLPGKPEMQQQNQESPAGNIEMNKYSVRRKGSRKELFLIAAVRVPEEMSRQPGMTEKLLEIARNDIIASSHGQLESEEEIVLGNYPGKELRLVPSSGAIRARVYGTKNSAYEIAVLASKARMSSADVQKFFDSFKILAESGEINGALENTSGAPAQVDKPACVTPPSSLAYWWRCDGNARDALGGNNGTSRGGVTYTSGEVGLAFKLDGTGFISTTKLIANPQTFSLGLWFRTAGRSGGVLISFDSTQASVASGSLYDRNLYMDDSGALHFGVWNRAAVQINTHAGYNDGKWHFVVASLSASTGLSLYVDGALAGNNPAVTGASETYNGWWRIGEGNLSNWPNPPRSANPTSYYFKGQIDEVAIFNTALAPNEVAAIYRAGSGGMCPP